MPLRTQSVAVTTDASGDFTGYTGNVGGWYLDRIYVADTDMGAGTNLTITDEDTGLTLLDINAGISTATYPVRIQATDTGGSGIAGAYYAVQSNGRFKVVVDTGGDTKSCTITFYLTDVRPDIA